MRHILLLFASVISLAVCAQTYDLSMCKEMVVKNNRQLQSSRIDIKNSAEDKSKAFTNYFPELSATGLGMWATDYLVSVPPMLNLLDKAYVGILQLSQPIFAGGQIVNGNRLATLRQEMSQLQYVLNEDEIVQQCTNNYWQVQNIRAAIATVNHVDTLLREIQRQTVNMVRVGIRLPADTLQIQLRRQELESNRLSLSNAESLCLMALATLMNVDYKTFDVCTETFVMPQNPAQHFVDADIAVSCRPEYLLSNKSVEASKLSYKMELGKYLPTVGLSINGMAQRMMDRTSCNAMLAVAVSIPISNWWGGSYSLKKAKNEKAQAILANDEARANLIVDINSSWNNVNESYSQIEVALHSVELARENFRLNSNYYSAGITGMIQLLDAENQLRESENNLYSVFAIYNIRLADYLRKVRQ